MVRAWMQGEIILTPVRNYQIFDSTYLITYYTNLTTNAILQFTSFHELFQNERHQFVRP